MTSLPKIPALLYRVVPFLLLCSCKTGNTNFSKEAIIEHYKAKPEDTLKLKAALFLLENLNGLTTLNSASLSKAAPFYKYMEDAINEVDAANKGVGKRKVEDDVFARQMDSLIAFYRAKEPDRLMAPVPQYNSDSVFITTDFIIDNIDNAFHTWKTLPWARQLSFDTFCEYLLPYRAADTWWDSARSYFTNKYQYLSDSLKNEQNLFAVGEAMRSDIHLWFKEDGTFSANYAFLKPMPFERILKGRRGDCYEATLLRVTAMRMLGLPVAFEMIPQWGNVDKTHFFYKVIDPAHDTVTGKINNANVYRDTRYIVEGSSFDEKLANAPRDISIVYNKSIPKVYRACFSIQQSSLAYLKEKKETIPVFFQSNRLKDVTGKYVETASVEMPLAISENKHAYLCVFTPKGWEPVSWATISNNKAVFSNMGKNIVYLPAFCVNNEIIPAAAAFLLKLDGTMQLLEPARSKQELLLTRKFRISSHNIGNAMQSVGARFQGANNGGLTDAINLHTIQDLKLSFTRVPVSNPDKFRYVTFRFDSVQKSAVSEIEIWGIKNGQDVKLMGEPIGNPGDYKNNRTNAFDGNSLSYFMSVPGKENYIGLDLGAPYKITEIRYCPRNDDNNITAGDLYELFYWNNQWISLGTQTGKALTPLIYKAPTNALFWLRNTTKGNEERIFTYEHNQQLFW